MKNLFKIIKIVTIITFLVACVIGYNFASVWQSDAESKVLESDWEKDVVQFGTDANLTVKMKVPWHRDLSSGLPVGVPRGLVVKKNKETFEKGKLDWKGYRTWKVQCVLSPVEAKLATNREIKFSLEIMKRMKKNMISVALPELDIVMPENTPVEPINTLTKIDPALANIAEVSNAAIARKRTMSVYLIIAVVLGLLLVSYLVYLKINHKAPQVPVWKIALDKLTNLQNSRPESNEVFYITLTDIIKTYTEKRYSFNSNSESSSEYLESLKLIENLDEADKESLISIIKDADFVKFAGGSSDVEIRDNSIENARHFIQSTVPQPTTEKHA